MCPVSVSRTLGFLYPAPDRVAFSLPVAAAMYYLFLTLFLVLFWTLLSGHFSALLLSMGVVSSILVVWFLRRMDKVDGEVSFMRPSLALGTFLGWLFLEVVRANIDVARRVWDPKLPIAPRTVKIKPKTTDALNKTLYANSITLTPGTLTTHAEQDYFLVHCLTEQHADDLQSGRMEDRIHSLVL